MKKRKKLIIFLLVIINSLVSATSNISGKLITTYGRLFKNSKSDSTGDKSSGLLEKTLVERNVELNDIYIEKDNERPEYLEWLMFSGNFSNISVNNMLNSEFKDNNETNYADTDKSGQNKSIMPVLSLNIQRKWDRTYKDDHFDEVIKKSTGRDINGYSNNNSYLELLEEVTASELSKIILLSESENSVGKRAYIKGNSVLFKNKNETEKIQLNENLAVGINMKKEKITDFQEGSFKFSEENSKEGKYIVFGNDEIKILPSKTENTVIFTGSLANINTDTSYMSALDNDYIGFKINYEEQLKKDSKIKTDNTIINNIINFSNTQATVFMEDTNRSVYNSPSYIDSLSYGNTANIESLYLKTPSAVLDMEGSLRVSLENSELEFFDPFIIKEPIINKQRSLLLVSEEAATSQSSKIRVEKMTINETEESYIPTGGYENSSIAIGNSLVLLTDKEENTEVTEENSENLDMSVNYYTLAGILDIKEKHIYSYLNLGMNQTTNFDEMIPKASHNRFIVNDLALRSDLMERLNLSQMLYTSNPMNKFDNNNEEKATSWRLKAALDFTYDFNS